ncbi:hypothetical protein ACLGFC_34715, partial [Klebsiella michiganensis]
YLVLYNSKRPHKSLELMTPVDYILRESKNCNMWWTHTVTSFNTVASLTIGVQAVFSYQCQTIFHTPERTFNIW